MEASPAILAYQRARFATQLPLRYRYSRSHAWLAEQPGGLWRVGLTKFATRLLGETVDHGFQLEPGAAVRPGETIGWIEGFKAVSDLYGVMTGTFEGGNPALGARPDLVNDDPYGAGWLYAVRGSPDPQCLDAYGYRDVLDETIDKLLERRRAE